MHKSKKARKYAIKFAGMHSISKESKQVVNMQNTRKERKQESKLTENF